MAWAAFKKSNWTRTVPGAKAVQYFPAASNSTATGNLTIAAGGSSTLTLTADFQFQGNGPVTVFAPEGAGSGWATAAAQGVYLLNAWLEGPASGSYAAGNHPVIKVVLGSTTLCTTAATGFDLIGVQR